MNKHIEEKLLSLLVDGGFLSGQKLAKQLQVSRTVIWKAVQAVKDNYGLDIYAVTGRGYRIAEPLELFDQAKLVRGISDSGCTMDYSLHLHTKINSTNQFLLETGSESNSYQVCLAEKQEKDAAGEGVPGFHLLLKISSCLFPKLLIVQ